MNFSPDDKMFEQGNRNNEEKYYQQNSEMFYMLYCQALTV
jgi:hypothetical protein